MADFDSWTHRHVQRYRGNCLHIPIFCEYFIQLDYFTNKGDYSKNIFLMCPIWLPVFPLLSFADLARIGYSK